MDTKQLYKRELDEEFNEVGQEEFSPATTIESVYDSETNVRLDQILKLINHWYLPYTGDASTTYAKIRPSLRHVGLLVSYRDENDSIVTRQYNGASYNDSAWTNLSNWVNK